LTDYLPTLSDLLARMEQGRLTAVVIAEDVLQALVEVRQRVTLAAVDVVDAEVAQRDQTIHGIDLDAALVKLRAQGPGALSSRERRRLVSAPEYLDADDIDRLLERYPFLAKCALTSCLAFWPRYLSASWGQGYRAALERHAAQLDLPLLRNALSLNELLEREVATAGHKRLAALLAHGSLSAVHKYLRETLGVRDSWLFMQSVLLEHVATEQSDRQLDSLHEVLADAPLQSAMLPVRRDAPVHALRTVRRDTPLQAETVSTLLLIAYRALDDGKADTLERLIEHVLASDFGDPRTPVPSNAWMLVRKSRPHEYQRLLARLAEQDLDIFFSHAMKERDRRNFWLRYVGVVERTGCVLDRGLRTKLQAKLAAIPGMRGAIERTFPFARASDVQAFFLVFQNHVVVEFSERGNAAYVYSRSYFAEHIEPQLHVNRVSDTSDLKIQSAVVHRLLHQRSWQDAARSWLAENGIHARDERAYRHV
jgi:hypothetical protein